MKTYFACVSDSKNYQPRVIFIPMKDISKDLLDKITKLTSLGNNIGEVYHYEKGHGRCIGYNIEGNLNIPHQKFLQLLIFFKD